MTSKALLFRLVPLLGSLLLCVLTAELTARVLMARPTMHLGVEMWKYAKDVKLRSPNPEIGHRHRPNMRCHLMGVDVKTNSLGMRDLEREPVKPTATYRILVLGDSITFGWGVPFAKTYCQLLEKSLNADPPIVGRRFEVVNAGVGNVNTTMEVAYFREEGHALQPDLVLLGWFINDAEPPPVPRGGWLARHSYAYVWLDAAIDDALRGSRGRPNYRAYYRGLYRDAVPGWSRCQQALQELADLCRARGVPCRVFLIPELHSLGGQYDFTDVHDAVRAACVQAGIPTCDLLDAFPADADPKRFWVSPTDAHPNADANEVMAASMEAWLRQDSELWD